MRLRPAPDATGAWFESRVGRQLVDAEAEACRATLSDVCGTFGALFGVGSPDGTLLEGLEFSARHAFAVGEGNGQFHSPVQARPSELPIASESLRLVVLQHLLETMRDPAEFLAECDRILAPGGTLAVLGLNPTGRILRWGKTPPPWVRRWWTPGAVRQAVDRGAFELASSRPILTASNWWERLGRGRELSREGRALGLLGSAYLVVFTKPSNGARVIPLGRAAARGRVSGVTSTVGSLSVNRRYHREVARRAGTG